MGITMLQYFTPLNFSYNATSRPTKFQYNAIFSICNDQFSTFIAIGVKTIFQHH